MDLNQGRHFRVLCPRCYAPADQPVQPSGRCIAILSNHHHRAVLLVQRTPSKTLRVPLDPLDPTPFNLVRFTRNLDSRTPLTLAHLQSTLCALTLLNCHSPTPLDCTASSDPGSAIVAFQETATHTSVSVQCQDFHGSHLFPRPCFSFPLCRLPLIFHTLWVRQHYTVLPKTYKGASQQAVLSLSPASLTAARLC